jgi:hypothetical protein
MVPALNKKRVETVIGVVAVDLILFFSNGQFSSHYANARVRPIAIVLGPLLVALGILAQVLPGRDARCGALRRLAYGLTLISAMVYGLVLLVAGQRLMFFQRLP